MKSIVILHADPEVILGAVSMADADAKRSMEASSDAPVCAACGNDDDGVSALQRCDGPCNRWFCIEGSCASTLGVPYDKNLTAGALVCSACEKLEAKLKMKAATATAPRLLQASDDQ